MSKVYLVHTKGALTSLHLIVTMVRTVAISDRVAGGTATMESAMSMLIRMAVTAQAVSPEQTELQKDLFGDKTVMNSTISRYCLK